MVTNRLGNLVVGSTHFHHFGDQCLLPASNYRLDTVSYQLQCIPESQVSLLLALLELDLFTIREVLRTVATYHPNQEIVMS